MLHELDGALPAQSDVYAELYLHAHSPDNFDDAATLAFANSDPTGFVQALPARAIPDEVQRAPGLLRSIKLVVDRDRQAGRFVLTGSANLLLLPQIGDSLAGRMEVIPLQPLTAAEVARHKGAFLAALINGHLKPTLGTSAKKGTQSLATRVVAGGFPEAVSRTPARARAWHREYLRSIVERDVRDIARVRDVNEIARLLEVLAPRTAQLLNGVVAGKRSWTAPRNHRPLPWHP